MCQFSYVRVYFITTVLSVDVFDHCSLPDWDRWCPDGRCVSCCTAYTSRTSASTPCGPLVLPIRTRISTVLRSTVLLFPSSQRVYGRRFGNAGCADGPGPGRLVVGCIRSCRYVSCRCILDTRADRGSVILTRSSVDRSAVRVSILWRGMSLHGAAGAYWLTARND